MSLELSHISVSIEGKAVVHDASLSVESGTISVLLGKNGSGKSTLVNAVMGHPLVTLTSGTIVLDGQDITTLPPDKKAQKGLFLSQQHTPKIGGVTLADFLHKAYESVHCREVPALPFYLEQKKIADKLGLDGSLLERPLTAELSGGERKQAEVLQLAVLEPQYALLDEIDSGVDITALDKVFGAIRLLAENGTAFLVISHHPSIVERLSPSRVYTIQSGVLSLTEGPPAH